MPKKISCHARDDIMSCPGMTSCRARGAKPIHPLSGVYAGVISCRRRGCMLSVERKSCHRDCMLSVDRESCHRGYHSERGTKESPQGATYQTDPTKQQKVGPIKISFFLAD